MFDRIDDAADRNYQIIFDKFFHETKNCKATLSNKAV